jgi:hypothetical protein
MKPALVLAAAGEAVFGVLLLVYPPIVVKLLFGVEISGVGVVVSRIAGMSLLALGLACWPADRTAQPLSGMLTYSTVATVYLIYLGLGGKWSGPLLWPAAAVHAFLTILLARTLLKKGKAPRNMAGSTNEK